MFFIFLFLCNLLGCSGLEKSEKEKLREQNAKGEYIYRYHDEVFYPLPPPPQRQKNDPYPWDDLGEKWTQVN